MACDFVVVGIGIEPEIPSFAGQPVAQSNGVLVDELCRASAPDLYAAGDVANHLHPVFGRVRVEHYNNGEKQGSAAARSMLGSTAPYDYIHSFWFDQYEHKLEYVGHATKWDQFVVRGSVEERTLVGFYLLKDKYGRRSASTAAVTPSWTATRRWRHPLASWAFVLGRLLVSSQTNALTCGRWRAEADARPPAPLESTR